MNAVSAARKDENERWKALISESKAGVEKYLDREIDMDLASFIRCITFRVFSIVFLGVDPDALAFENVKRVTGALADFYDDGQGESTLPFEVQSILYQWLPCNRFPSSLDRILPTYEALWRIVATIVVTCEEDETKSKRWVLLDFRDNPRDRQYRVSLWNDGQSVSAITDNIVSHLTPIARPQRHSATPDWPLGCIQNASCSGSAAGQPPTVDEALKFAALLASRVIGQVGLYYKISADGIMDSRASPWDRRRIFGVDGAVHSHVATNVFERFPHASSSSHVH